MPEEEPQLLHGLVMQNRPFCSRESELVHVSFAYILITILSRPAFSLRFLLGSSVFAFSCAFFECSSYLSGESNGLRCLTSYCWDLVVQEKWM